VKVLSDSSTLKWNLCLWSKNTVHCSDSMQYFWLLVWKWICVRKMPYAFWKLEEKALLLLDCPDPPPAGVLKSTERKNDQSYISAKDYYCTDSDNGSRHHQAFKAYYCNELLGGDVSSEFQVMEFLKTLTLMNAVYSWFSLAESYMNYYCKLLEKVCWKRWCHWRQGKVNSTSKIRYEGCVWCTW
jgi:hypothetical protein